MEQNSRPLYYEGQYLGADDLEALLRYARVGQARGGLGAHVWGIAVGLDLVERSLGGGDVEVVLTPGVAWDGHGRSLVASAPQRLGLDLFAALRDDTPPGGIPVEIWLAYRELPASPPGVGFACPDDDARARAVETFRLEVRPSPVSDYHAVSIAGRSIEAREALRAFDATRPLLYDESVPQQAYPESGDKPAWPLFVGVVRWRKDAGQPGRLVAKSDDDRNRARAGRRYVGAVAATIVAPDGVLRVRDRAKDPADPAVNFTPPIVAAPAGTAVVNDLVWCEGHLRVVGDVRLQGGVLDYRVARGGDSGVPMYLRRTSSGPPAAKTSLDAFIGPPVPALPPDTAQTRFTVSSTDAAGQPKECLTVVTDGHVGVNAADPSATVHVRSASAPQGELRLFSATADFEYDGGADQLFVFKDTGGKTAFVGGNIGIGTVAPRAKLEVQGNPDQRGTAIFTADPAKGPNPSHVHWDPTGDWYIRSAAPAGKVVIQDSGGNVGIGTSNPAVRLDVNGDLHVNGYAFVPFGGIWMTSDRREKKDIEPLERPLDRLLRLRGVSFAWREPQTAAAAPGRRIGFIAQEVERAFPEWVTTTPWGTKAVNSDGFQALAVEAMREIAARCERLEAEVAELRARLGAGEKKSAAPRKEPAGGAGEAAGASGRAARRRRPKGRAG